MKVALVFFGQARFLDNPLSERSHKQFIIDKYQTDVFCHLWWSHKTQTYDCSSWSTIKECKVDNNAVGKIMEKYNPKKILIEEPKTFFHDYKCIYVTSKIIHDENISPLFRQLYNNADDVKTNINNIFSQMYSIETACKLLDDHIKQSQEEYNFIIISRYDNHLLDFPNLEELDPNEFYISDHHPNFPDLIYVIGQKFLQTQFIYSSFEICDLCNMSELFAEQFKLNAYQKFAGNHVPIAIPMPVHVIRGNVE